MLNITTSLAVNPAIKKMRVLLKTMLIENGVIPGPRAFESLMASLRPSKTWTALPATFSFVENCVSRIIKQPVHYLDLRSLVISADTGHLLCDMLTVCVAEQWPFTTNSETVEVQKNTAEWIARFFSAIEEKPEQNLKLASVREQMETAVDGDARFILNKAFKKANKHPAKVEIANLDESVANGVAVIEEAKTRLQEVQLEDMFVLPVKAPGSLGGLDRWDTTDLETAVSNGRLGRLLQCIASEEEEIRRQAFLILRTLMGQVKVNFLSSPA